MVRTRAAILRRGKNLTQIALAKLAVVSQSEISHLENGARRPSRPRLIRIAAVLGFDGPPEGLFEQVPLGEVESSTEEGQ